MNKKALCAIPMLFAALASSCIRSDDWDLLKALAEGNTPVRVEGNLSPTVGAPIAYASLSVADLVGLLDEDYRRFVDTTDIVTILYDTTLSGVVMPSGNSLYTRHHRPHLATKDDPIIYTVDTTLIYSLDVDFFDNIDLDGRLTTDFALGKCRLDLESDLIADASPEVRQRLESYLSATVDSLTLTYIDRDGQLQTVEEVHLDPVEMSEILNGTHLEIHDVNVSEVFNQMPSNITAAVRITLNVHQSVLNEDLSNIHFGDMLELLELRSLSYTAHLGIRFPLSFRINDITFRDNLDVDAVGIAALNDGLDELAEQGIDARLGHADLTLNIVNGLPLSLTCRATALDAAGNVLDEIIPQRTIGAASTTASRLLDGYQETATPWQGPISVTLDADKTQSLLDAHQIALYLNLNTNGQPVVLRKQDFLKVKAIAKANVSADIHTDLGSDNN